MKKSLILIPLLIVALWLGLTWIIGSQTQSGFTLGLEKVNQKLGTASIVEESYSRGFLSSEAVAKITGPTQADTKKTDAFLKFQVWHGPLMMTPEGMKFGAEYALITLDQSRLPEKIQEKIAAGFQGAEPFTLGVFTGFGGQVSIDATISPFSISKKDSDSMSFEGLTSDFQTDINGSFAVGNLKFGSINYEDKKSKKHFSLAAGNGDLNYKNIIANVAADGTAHLIFPEIKGSQDGVGFAIENLTLESLSKQKSGKLDVSSKISIAEFKGPDKGAYAETFSKLNGEMEIESISEGMDIESLKLMAKAQQKMQQSQADQELDAEAKQQALHDYLISVSTLLQPGYKMKNHLLLSGKDGESELGLGLEYTGKKPLFELATIRELIESLEVALNLQVAKNLIPAAAAQKIQPAVGMGFILSTKDLYKADAILAKGELTVNGKANPVLKNMAALLDQPIPWEKMGFKQTK